MNIETVNELIQSLESAGELTIREEKFLKLARAYVQLAADNVVLKSAHPQPFGPEMMKALEAYEKQQDEAPETGMLDAFFILRDSIRVETPATDRIVAGIKADGATAAGDYLKLNAQHMAEVERLMMQDAAEICYGTAARLREGAK